MNIFNRQLFSRVIAMPVSVVSVTAVSRQNDPCFSYLICVLLRAMWYAAMHLD